MSALPISDRGFAARWWQLTPGRVVHRSRVLADLRTGLAASQAPSAVRLRCDEVELFADRAGEDFTIQVHTHDLLDPEPIAFWLSNPSLVCAGFGDYAAYLDLELTRFR